MNWEYLIARMSMGSCVAVLFKGETITGHLNELDDKRLIDVLDGLGVHGWELIGNPVTVDDGSNRQDLYFKRPR